jgi:radical SAM-linked protein
MHKIVVRSALPLWYTEGFNPKPKMVFAAPLSIGTESKCEYMDLKLTERVPEKTVMDALNRNMTHEMQVEKAYYPDKKLSDIGFLSYTVLIHPKDDVQVVATACADALSREKIEVVKKGKGGEATVDIKPLIRSYNVCADGDNVKINCILSANPSSFLNPELVLKYLKTAVGILKEENIMDEYYSIMREHAYFSDMSDFE